MIFELHLQQLNNLNTRESERTSLHALNYVPVSWMQSGASSADAAKQSRSYVAQNLVQELWAIGSATLSHRRFMQI